MPPENADLTEAHPHLARLQETFARCFGGSPTSLASAPGRLEVLGNHTDYNAGLTLSCAVGFRCYAALAPLDKPEAILASTAYGTRAQTYTLARPLRFAPKGHWANYILGLVAALQERGHRVPGFALLVDSTVPRSAGVSSSAALEMAVLTALAGQLRIELPEIERARIGQWAESRVVGARTGLLDQFTSLCGQRDQLLYTDFRSLEHHLVPLPPGLAWVAIDSGVRHDLTAEYNDRRASCETAAKALKVNTLREAHPDQLIADRQCMDANAYHCATHILRENRRVMDAATALAAGQLEKFGQLLFDSHDSSRDFFRNSCDELDIMIELARQDPRCLGARLSGGGFGGISIHLVRREEAEAYRNDVVNQLPRNAEGKRWSATTTIDTGATLHV